VISKSGLLTTLGYKIGSQKAVYALEGSIAIAGALVQWLRDNLGLIENRRMWRPWLVRWTITAVLFCPGLFGVVCPLLEIGRARLRCWVMTRYIK